MANPKRKHSKARSRKRRAHQGLAQPDFVQCPRCGQPKLPHRVCNTCEHFEGREYAIRRPEKTK